MRSKLIHQWKYKRRARLSFLGVEIFWIIVLSIIQVLVYQWYLDSHPEDAELVFKSNFYYQFSFSLFGLMEVVSAVVQIYIFSLILTQRIRDIGIKYPLIIALAFTCSSLFITPLTFINQSSFLMIFMAIQLIFSLIVLFTPSARETKSSVKNDVI
ncbi:hypothetical protein [Providencia alcalifaciens]|uniref:hypothetical protein n=1 Tax=Providencia alcalifaciens TaxID=126385 RepID=UPI001CC6F095|nr:hypothetical protein [Providencia alcalifaciens]CAG9418330.1 hypothetical protein NVI2019_GHJFPKLH_01632 [Providencia alcalifaciens]